MSQISATDAALSRAGNRFDVPGGGVLYLATSLTTCYAETLARFRPSAKVRAAVEGEDNGFMVCGGVPADWRAQRVKVTVELVDSLPFLDVEASATHEFLTTVMASELAALEVDVLDIAAMRGPDRRVTRAVAAWAHGAIGEGGLPLFSGIRYLSRLNGEECWAVFDGTPIAELSRDTISLHDSNLQQIADSYGLRIF